MMMMDTQIKVEEDNTMNNNNMDTMDRLRPQPSSTSTATATATATSQGMLMSPLSAASLGNLDDLFGGEFASLQTPQPLQQPPQPDQVFQQPPPQQQQQQQATMMSTNVNMFEDLLSDLDFVEPPPTQESLGQLLDGSEYSPTSSSDFSPFTIPPQPLQQLQPLSAMPNNNNNNNNTIDTNQQTLQLSPFLPTTATSTTSTSITRKEPKNGDMERRERRRQQQQHERHSPVSSEEDMSSVSSIDFDDMSDEDDLASRPFAQRSRAKAVTSIADLTDEEVVLLRKHGFSVPVGRDFTKAEIAKFKVTRRKIKNKISAESSRRKKRHYIKVLEDKLSKQQNTNVELEEKCGRLEEENSSIFKKLLQLQSRIRELAKPGTASASTALMLLALSFSLFVNPNLTTANGGAFMSPSASSSLPNSGFTASHAFSGRTLASDTVLQLPSTTSTTSPPTHAALAAQQHQANIISSYVANNEKPPGMDEALWEKFKNIVKGSTQEEQEPQQQQHPSKSSNNNNSTVNHSGALSDSDNDHTPQIVDITDSDHIISS